jgi:hypothetical protein
MIKSALLHIKLRTYIFLRHLGQSTAACLLAMTRGDVSAIGIDHWLIALTTGGVTGTLGVLVSLTPLRRHYGNKWFFAAVVFIGTFVADWLTHPSHFGGPLTEAFVTGAAAAFISLILSHTPLFNVLSHLEFFSPEQLLKTRPTPPKSKTLSEKHSSDA